MGWTKASTARLAQQGAAVGAEVKLAVLVMHDV
jgi:hypothetical protein